MKLNSKIATSIEQSKKLLELGLDPETADMVYDHGSALKCCRPATRQSTLLYPYIKRERGQEGADEWFERLYGKDVPSWSLSRLIELMPNTIKGKKTGVMYELDIMPDGIEVNYSRLTPDGEYQALHTICLDGEEATLFDVIIDMIDYLMKNNYFKKEYVNKNK